MKRTSSEALIIDALEGALRAGRSVENEEGARAAYVRDVRKSVDGIPLRPDVAIAHVDFVVRFVHVDEVLGFIGETRCRSGGAPALAAIVERVDEARAVVASADARVVRDVARGERIRGRIPVRMVGRDRIDRVSEAPIAERVSECRYRIVEARARDVEHAELLVPVRAFELLAAVERPDSRRIEELVRRPVDRERPDGSKKFAPCEKNGRYSESPRRNSCGAIVPVSGTLRSSPTCRVPAGANAAVACW